MNTPILRPGRPGDKPRIISLYKKVSRSNDGLARTYDEITEEYVEGFIARSLQDGLQFVMEDPSEVPELLIIMSDTVILALS